MINQAIKEMEWELIKIARNCLGLTHLFFADDIILFAKARISQVQII